MANYKELIDYYEKKLQLAGRWTNMIEKAEMGEIFDTTTLKEIFEPSMEVLKGSMEDEIADFGTIKLILAMQRFQSAGIISMEQNDFDDYLYELIWAYENQDESVLDEIYEKAKEFVSKLPETE